jgi:ribosome biogenesis GTPase A
MFPSPKSLQSAYRIASIGSIRDTAMEYEGTACFLIDLLIAKKQHSFLPRYNIAVNDESIALHAQEIIKKIAKYKTNSNTKQAAKNVVHDFRNGHFG